jgi:hypothetical protein
MKLGELTRQLEFMHESRLATRRTSQKFLEQTRVETRPTLLQCVFQLEAGPVRYQKGPKHFSSLRSASRIKKLAIGLDTMIMCKEPLCILFPKLESLTFALFLTCEWLRYGEEDPLLTPKDLIPYLGCEAKLWRENSQAHIISVSICSLPALEVSVFTDAKLYPWMTRLLPTASLPGEMF